MATFNSANGHYQSGNKTLFETQMLALSNGHVVDGSNRLPVDIGTTSITISGNVNVNTPNTVTVQSSAEDPVDMHIRQVGNSGILEVPYLPISGNVIVTSGNLVLGANITVNNFPLTQNVQFSNQTIYVNGGNLSGIDATVVISNGYVTTQNVQFSNQSIYLNNNVVVNNTVTIANGYVTTQNVQFSNQSVYLNNNVVVNNTVAVSNGYQTTQNVAFSNQTIFVNGGQSNVGNFPTTQNVQFSNQTIFINGGQSNIGNFPASVNTSIHHSNGANITSAVPLPVTASIVNPVSLLYSFNNFGVFNHRGWSVSDTLIPMFSVRAKSTATHNVNIINYDIGNNNANQSTIGYIWIEDAVISGSVPAWSSLNTEAEYRFYTDAYGSNTPNGVSGGTQRHAGIIIGKNSSAESDIADINMIAGGVTMTLCLIRLDSATKLDVWVAVDLSILS